MATATTIQYLESTDAVTGASLGLTPSDRLQVETFLFTNTNAVGGASITLTAKQLAALDVSKMTDTSGGTTALFVTTADFNSAPVQKIVVGCFAETITVVPQQTVKVKVVVRGPVIGVPAVGAIAQGQPVILDPAGAAGSCAVQQDYNAAVAAPVQEAFGFALTAAAAGVVSVYVLGKGI